MKLRRPRLKRALVIAKVFLTMNPLVSSCHKKEREPIPLVPFEITEPKVNLTLENHEIEFRLLRQTVTKIDGGDNISIEMFFTDAYVDESLKWHEPHLVHQIPVGIHISDGKSNDSSIVYFVEDYETSIKFGGTTFRISCLEFDMHKPLFKVERIIYVDFTA